jgi:hypothetical protein
VAKWVNDTSQQPTMLFGYLARQLGASRDCRVHHRARMIDNE